MKPLISVIVPVYAAQSYLHRCADSILGQTYENLEAILVDDGSTDESPAICDAYAEKDARVRVIHKENGGLISAWTRGVRESRGAYLCFVDSDDWIEPNMLEEMAEHLKEIPGEVICGNFVIDRPGRTTEHLQRLSAGTYEGESLDRVKRKLLGKEEREICMSRCMKLFSRELIENNLHYCNPAIRMGEDVNIVLPALLDAGRLVILPGALHYHYLYHEASMVHRYDAGLYANLQLLAKTIGFIFREKGIENGEEQTRREYLYLLLLAMKNELRGGQPGYAERIRRICLENETAEQLKQEKLPMESKSNRLLAFLMKHPNPAVIGMVKIATEAFDRVK